ncbi:MAG: aminotransferase class I/II-fold pyridoxal phosphate-dependent enzyme, partial [Chitinophagales bacterium]
MDKPFLSEVIEKLRMVLPHGKEIALHEPCFSGNEWNYIRQCLDTGWVSSVGQYVKSFEEQLAEYIGVKYAVALVNGTAALHLSLILAGVGPGDEVLVPALSFVATANAVAYCGATPHFVDSEEVTLGMDPCKLEIYLNDIARADSGSCINRLTGRPIKAVIPVHTFGHPADLDPLAEVCSIFHLELIEDATESLGSRYKGRPTGSRGRMAVLSFNGNKIVTTG